MAGKRLHLDLGGVRPDPAENWECVQLAGLGPATGGRWDEVAVHAASLAELRRALPWITLLGRARQVTVAIAATDRPALLRAPAAVGRRVPVEARVIRDGDGVRVVVVLPKPTEVGMTVRAVLGTGLRGAHRTAGLRVGIAAPDGLSWAAGDAAVTATGPAPAAPDVIVGVGGVRTPHVQPAGELPPVDTAVCSPAGFGPAGADVAQLAASATQLTLLTGPGGRRPLDPLVGLTENDLRAVRDAPALHVTGAGPGLGRVVAQLCVAGVPVRAPELPAAVADGLGAELATRLRTVETAALADARDRESWSIDTRRLALARFGPQEYWTRAAHELGRPAPSASVSVLLATRRTALLAFALAQIARQDWADLQVVLVLHGPSAADPAVQAALAGFDRPIEVVSVASDVVFGHALNAGLARCAGEFVTKFDDDDWYGRHHVTDLVQAHRHSGAHLVGVPGYYVHLAGPDVTIRWTQVPTEAPAVWVHGGTMLLTRADLYELGAWPGVPVGEDAHLLAAVRAAGGAIYGIHDLGFCYFRGRDHTWMPAEGDIRWLDADLARWPGFAPPPQLDPLPHPWLRS
jgi:hypothetical protein